MNSSPADTVFRYVHRLLQPPESLDRELLARFVSRRDEAAFAELVQRHGPLVYGTAIRPSSGIGKIFRAAACGRPGRRIRSSPG